MLLIREAQMKVFEQDKTRLWIEEYLRSSYPRQAAAIGPLGLEEFVRAAIRSARAHRLVEAVELRKYSHICFLLGLGFEDNPASAWAGKMIRDPKYKNAASCLRVIEDRVVKLLKKSPAAAPAKVKS